MTTLNDVIFRYREFNDRSLEIFKNRELWFATPDSFNDPFDCQVDYKEALYQTIKELELSPDINTLLQRLDEKIQKAKVCCFSQTKKNQLMWAHYADKHKGFCIGFKASNLLGYGNNLTTGVLPVDYKYLNPYQDITKNFLVLLGLGSEIQISKLSDQFLKSALTTKYTGWKYEKEVRLISTKIETLKFQPQSINSITFGLKMEDKNKSHLRTLLKGNEWSHVKWFETVKAKERYALNFNLI